MKYCEICFKKIWNKTDHAIWCPKNPTYEAKNDPKVDALKKMFGIKK